MNEFSNALNKLLDSIWAMRETLERDTPAGAFNTLSVMLGEIDPAQDFVCVAAGDDLTVVCRDNYEIYQKYFPTAFSELGGFHGLTEDVSVKPVFSSPERFEGMTLSTAHITPATSAFLDAHTEDIDLPYLIYDSGYILWLDRLPVAGLPHDLIKVIQFALDSGCSVLQLDGDGPIVPYLDNYAEIW